MRDEGLYPDDILEAAVHIQQFVGDVSKDKFLDSELLKSAVLHKLMVIGEASARISEELKARYPEIRWRSITGLRNIAVHVYFTVDWNMIWEIVQGNIPQLSLQISNVIHKDFPLPDDGETN